MDDIMRYVTDSVSTVNRLTGTEMEDCNLRKSQGDILIHRRKEDKKCA